MTEASQIKIRVDMGENNVNKKFTQMITLDKIISWIQHQELDEYTTKGLIDVASKYPTAALPSFRKNFNVMLQRVRAKRRLEQGEENAKVKPEISQEITKEIISKEESDQD